MVAGDFNHAKLTDTLPQLHVNVTIATRGDNTLDQVYTNRERHTERCPAPTWTTTFSSFLLIVLCSYTRSPHRRTSSLCGPGQPFTCSRTERLRPTRAGCNWRTMHQLYAVTSVNVWMTVTVARKITTRPNQKPWLNEEVRTRDAAFISGDTLAVQRGGIWRLELKERRQSMLLKFRVIFPLVAPGACGRA